MKTPETFVSYAAVVVVVAALIFSLLSYFDVLSIQGNVAKEPAPSGMAGLSRMPLTAFDIMLAKQFMDKDSDGKCDVCGMDVKLCIDSGQLQCNMDPQSTISILGSAHAHADFKVYINGEPLNFANPEYYMKSSFIHVDDNQNMGDASGVLHMHAKGVPLWIFFRSVGLEFNKDCLVVADHGKEEKFCNNDNSSLRFYVNGIPNTEFGNYVFNNLDKILISYGPVGENVQRQLASISDFAKLH